MTLKRDKIIRRIGDSVGIIFNKEECLLANIKVSDQVNVSITKLKREPNDI